MKSTTLLGLVTTVGAAVASGSPCTTGDERAWISKRHSIDYVQNYNGQSASFKYSQYDGTYSGWWSNPQDFVIGLGWSKGISNRVVKFSGSYNSNQGSYHAVYGWLDKPLTEYYVVENYSYDPCRGSATQTVGSVVSDGASYRICKHTQYNQTSIQGTKTFHQYFSVRQSKRHSGSVALAKHFNAWKKYGFANGAAHPDFNYQVFATEAFAGWGNVDVKISG
ncbi:hypothetical protein NDA14_001631 [Ustilago hordei]|uniref:Endo-1,4-beta-xylanase n=1 Tax=Ustilago hordei TaxID=120017 RepID=I2FN07_USTHO|nr:putative endo-1,4-beta-xylanase A precursor [Ustilago hordei]KAJ1573994.1 hypothetical protein NDA12_001259 [Ustilago hordei]KAJ1574588.1 hypothetical protein NDA15_006553 [Ustilago hordei]KAJ1599425.1 hypothetical protein NDA14_001631 [Ustilago hordei]UTT90762.1 hypothetical protein NDA17_000380 [Ustilago hordei]CCF48300.1 probable endo-1,4-beta-xylanase A precursor [Ustilago hordei]